MSEKYETIMSSKNIEYILARLLNDFQSQNNWDIPLDAALEQSKLVYKQVDDGLKTIPFAEKISCLKEIIIKKISYGKFLKILKILILLKINFQKYFVINLKRLKKNRYRSNFFLIKDPFVDEYFEWEIFDQ